MWSKQADCNRAAIDQFLDGQLDAEERQAFEGHLESCVECREGLNAKAAEPELWGEVRETLGSGESLMCGEIYASSLASYAVCASEGDNHDEDVLTFLKPTDDPRMLGRFGGYEIVGVVGRGGMGTVLKGFDASLNRYVAIKVLSPHLAASSAARKRFAREAQAAAAVVHDNVIAIHSVSEDNGLPYLVMSYERGASLQKRLDEEGSLNLVEVLRIAAQAASGLAAAHAQGLVHRDVKPGNILLADGVERVKLTDFGLARAADDASLTRTGVIAGTPQFMSPEQARGDRVDHRSDLFSLGSVLYAMCTGRPPFRAETSYGVLRRITDSKPRAVRELNPEMPTWLGRVIEKLHTESPDNRYESAAEVADLLEQCLAHVQEPMTVPLPESLLETSWETERLSLLGPRRLWAGGITAAVLALAAIVGLATWNGTPQAESDAPAASPPVQIAVIGVVDLDRDGLDDAPALSERKNKWGLQVVARVTPDGRRIGRQLTQKVRYLVVGKPPSVELAGHKRDGQLGRFDRESKWMRQEAIRNGIAAISASHLQNVVSAATGDRRETQTRSPDLQKEKASLRDEVRSLQMARDREFRKVVELTEKLHGTAGPLKSIQGQQHAETPEDATETEPTVRPLSPITKAAVIGRLDLDQDGVDDVQELMQPKNKWGIQVVAHVTPDGRRIGVPLAGAEVRYLVAGEASEEEPAVTADGPNAQFTRESKKMRDEGSENGARVFSPSELRMYIATTLKERRGRDCEDARCRYLIDEIGCLSVDRLKWPARIGETQLEIIDLSKPFEIPENADEETVAQLAQQKALNEAKISQWQNRITVLEGELSSIDAIIKFLGRRLADFPVPPVNASRPTDRTTAKANDTTSGQGGNQDPLQVLEAKHKELVRKRDDLFIKVIMLESLIVELELPVLIPDQSVQIPMDPKWPEWAKLELRAVREDLERSRQEKLRNQTKEEAVRERLSSLQAELRGVERQIELLEQRMNDLKAGSAQAEGQQRKKIVVTQIKDANPRYRG